MSVAMKIYLVGFWILICSSLSSAATDELDVIALKDMYQSLGYPRQLVRWRLDGRDPCQEHWKGISCIGTSVIYIMLPALELGGHLDGQLYFQHLERLDLSSNHLHGEVPILLLPRVTYVDLSGNHFSRKIPCSLSLMINLTHLNLSHNLFSGPIDDVFNGLQGLKRMDLSYNSFSGALPSSFGNLTGLVALYLQNNNFTGSVSVLTYLQLTYLDIRNNGFSGVLPEHFRYVPNIWIGGNSFEDGADWISANDHDINSLHHTREEKHKTFNIVACVVTAVVILGITITATIVCIMRKRSSAPGKEIKNSYVKAMSNRADV